MASEPLLIGWERVVDAGACLFCQEVDGAKLADADAMPLHPHCGCGIDPVEYEGIGRPAPLTPTPTPPGVTVTEHGELGPVLSGNESELTGAAQPQVYDDPKVQAAAEDWSRSLTEDERYAMKIYTEEAFGYSGVKQTEAEYDRNVASALRKGQLPKDQVLWRASSTQDVRAGDTVTLDRVMSSSFDRKIAQEDFGEAISFQEPFDLFRIAAPGGQRGGYASMTVKEFERQKEFTLPEGTRFKVVGIIERKWEHGEGIYREILCEQVA